MSSHKSIDLSLSSLSHHTLQFLHNEDIFTFEQLKDRFEVSEELFQRLENATLLKKLELTKPLDDMSYKELSNLISQNKKALAHAAFRQFVERDFSNCEDEFDEEIEFADEISIDSFFPTQTLFFDVRLIKGDKSLELTPLENIIEGFEQQVIETLGIKSFDVHNLEHQKSLLKCFKKTDWPCDTPIYIPMDIAHAYPYVISHLRKKATMILSKG